MGPNNSHPQFLCQNLGGFLLLISEREWFGASNSHSQVNYCYLLFTSKRITIQSFMLFSGTIFMCRMTLGKSRGFLLGGGGGVGSGEASPAR